jgi:hypothetical protein
MASSVSWHTLLHKLDVLLKEPTLITPLVAQVVSDQRRRLRVVLSEDRGGATHKRLAGTHSLCLNYPLYYLARTYLFASTYGRSLLIFKIIYMLQRDDYIDD